MMIWPPSIPRQQFLSFFEEKAEGGQGFEYPLPKAAKVARA